MQQISVQRSILYTILHFALFCAITTGCDWCKGSIDKSTTIHIETKPEEKEKSAPKKVSPDAPIKERALDSNDKKEENKEENGNNEDEDIKQKVEEELLAEQKRLEEEEGLLKKEEEEILNPEYIQNSSYDPQYEVQPSAPTLADDLPPSYDSHKWDSNLATSFTDSRPTPTPSNVCTDSTQNHNYAWDNDDLEDLRKNPSIKRKCIEAWKKTFSKLKLSVASRTKIYRHQVKETLENLENKKTKLEQRQNVIFTDQALSSKGKAKQLEEIFISIETINYEIKYWKNIIQTKEENNKSDQSTNTETPPYPTQEYAATPQSPVGIVDTPPPSYSTATNNTARLYPNIPTNY